MLYYIIKSPNIIRLSLHVSENIRQRPYTEIRFAVLRTDLYILKILELFINKHIYMKYKAGHIG